MRFFWRTIRFILTHIKMGSRSGAFRASSRRDYPSAGNRRSDHASGDSVSEIFRGDDNRRRADDHCEPRAWHSYDQSSFLNEAEMIVIHLRGEKTVENLKDFPYNETQCEKQTVDGRNKTDGDTGKIAGF